MFISFQRVVPLLKGLFEFLWYMSLSCCISQMSPIKPGGGNPTVILNKPSLRHQIKCRKFSKALKLLLSSTHLLECFSEQGDLLNRGWNVPVLLVLEKTSMCAQGQTVCAYRQMDTQARSETWIAPILVSKHFKDILALDILHFFYYNIFGLLQNLPEICKSLPCSNAASLKNLGVQPFGKQALRPSKIQKQSTNK